MIIPCVFYETCLPGAWDVLMGLWRIPASIGRHWWEAILQSQTPEERPVPFASLGPPTLTPAALMRRHLRLWSGEGSALAALLKTTLTPTIVLGSCEQLFHERLFTRREASHLQDLLLARVTSTGEWL